jgi:hypothetical protein
VYAPVVHKTTDANHRETLDDAIWRRCRHTVRQTSWEAALLAAIRAHEVAELRVVTAAIDCTGCIGPPVPPGKFDAQIGARGKK